MKKTILFLTFIGTLFTQTTAAKSYNQRSLFSDFSVSVGATASIAPGVHIEGATSLSEHFSLRAGITFMPFNLTINNIQSDVNIKEKAIYGYLEASGSDSHMVSSAKLNTFNGLLLVDYTPARKGFFHITGGIYVGESTLGLKGVLMNRKSNRNLVEELKEKNIHSDLTVTADNDMKIRLNDDGSYRGTIFLGNKVKPYLGLGIGRAIPNSRLGFKATLGILYLGSLRISSPNIYDHQGQLFNKTSLYSELVAHDSDYAPFIGIAQFSPLLNLQLVVRLN